MIKIYIYIPLLSRGFLDSEVSAFSSIASLKGSKIVLTSTIHCRADTATNISWNASLDALVVKEPLVVFPAIIIMVVINPYKYTKYKKQI